MNFDGTIVINKPADWTSQDVCSKLKGRVHMKKIGHTGTLDPMATGVLPVCFGKATRIIEYYDKDKKSYRAKMQLGLITDTLDITGEVLERRDYGSVTEDAIVKAFTNYTGDIAQIPPKYSAVQINGRRAYDMARAGEEVKIKPRNITIYKNEIKELDLQAGTLEFDVICSKGTYIRTICDDIGRELGCGATMIELTRTASGPFTLEDSHELMDIIEMSDEEILALALKMDETLCNLGTICVKDDRVIAFGNGHPSGSRTYCVEEETSFDNFYKVYGKDEFLGIGQVIDGNLIPYKVIFER